MWTNDRRYKYIDSIRRQQLLTIQHDTKYQQLEAIPMSILINNRPMKINSNEFVMIDDTLGVDSVSNKYVLAFISIIKYNKMENKWYKRKIILNPDLRDSNDEAQLSFINSKYVEPLNKPPTIHDAIYDAHRNMIYMIDDSGKLWIIDTNNDKIIEKKKLQGSYGIFDLNEPKLVIAEDHLYILTPDSNNGRYSVDLSKDDYPITRLGLLLFKCEIYIYYIYIYILKSVHSNQNLSYTQNTNQN